MTVSPMRVARIAAAKRHVHELLAGRGCPFPEEAARDVIDELLKLNWIYPGALDDEVIPQPSTSSQKARDEAKRQVAEAVRNAKARRGAPYGDDTDARRQGEGAGR